MENSSLAFFPNSADSFSMRREAKPDPVPPPNEWNTGSCNVKMNKLLTHLPYREIPADPRRAPVSSAVCSWSPEEKHLTTSLLAPPPSTSICSLPMV